MPTRVPAAIACLAIAIPAPAQPYYASMGAKEPLAAANAPVELDTYLFTTSVIGAFPRPGPHILFDHYGGRDGYMRSHLAKLQRDIDARIPDPNATGLAIIDYEDWWPFWTDQHNEPSDAPPDAQDHDTLDDWRDHIRTTHAELLTDLSPELQESVFASTFLATAEFFWSETLRECQRLRPNIQWGFYGLPPRDYWLHRRNDQAGIDRWKARNDQELAWLWDQTDALYPSVYTFYASTPGTPGKGQDAPSDNAKYIRANIEEAVRLANGKPVYAFVWWRYHSSNQQFGDQFLTPLNLKQALTNPLESGATGVVLWEKPLEGQDLIAAVRYAKRQVVPLLRDVRQPRRFPD